MDGVVGVEDNIGRVLVRSFALSVVSLDNDHINLLINNQGTTDDEGNPCYDTSWTNSQGDGMDWTGLPVAQAQQRKRKNTIEKLPRKRTGERMFRNKFRWFLIKIVSEHAKTLVCQLNPIPQSTEKEELGITPKCWCTHKARFYETPSSWLRKLIDMWKFLCSLSVHLFLFYSFSHPHPPTPHPVLSGGQ